MDISGRLHQLAEKLRDPQRNLTADSMLCQQAAQHIYTQESYIRSLKAQLNDRWQRHFNAALTGLLANGAGNKEAHTRATEAALMAFRTAPARPVGDDS